MNLEIKTQLYALCLGHVDENIEMEKTAMAEVEEAAELEAKSSVGDKYETGRSMMHIEIDKHKAQVAQYLQQRTILDQINVSVEVDEVKPGSVVITDKYKYFISIGIGELELNGETFCTMSLGSPLGKEFSHKRVGDTIAFREKEFKILDIV
ncbi:MAG: GreA/GreB family elongation factor [Fibrobacterales bacterium]